MGASNSWSLERRVLGELMVFPGHPIVLAYLIMHQFASLEEAAGADPESPSSYSRALACPAIPGGGGEVVTALRLLQELKGSPEAEAVSRRYSDRWVTGLAGGHSRNVTPGQAQADRIHAAFLAKASEWLVSASAIDKSKAVL